MTHRACGSVPRGHTKCHTGQAAGCQGVTPNVTPGKAGAVPGGRRRVRGIRTPGADRVGGSLEEASDSEDGAGLGRRKAPGERIARKMCDPIMRAA